MPTSIRFNPRAPHGARLCTCSSVCLLDSVSIHAPRTGRDFPHGSFEDPYGVSIHAPRTGRDGSGDDGLWRFKQVSIHAPRTGRDPDKLCNTPGKSSFNPRAPHGARQPFLGVIARRVWFQSTRPARGATGISVLLIIPRGVSIHAPRTGRDTGTPWRNYPPAVSIHAPRTGRDNIPASSSCMVNVFQSTRPARGATFSIKHNWRGYGRFNPRAPHGARL